MKRALPRVWIYLLCTAVMVLILDQITKNVALSHLTNEGDTSPVLDWFSYTLVHNHGAAFGMFRNLPDGIRRVFFILLPLSILTLLYFAYIRNFKKTEVLGPIAMGLVVGGAIGNFIDRLRFGYVIDFIDWFYPNQSGSCLPQFNFYAGHCHWPVFNVADSAICIAMGLLIVHSFANDKKSQAPSRK